MKINEDLLPKNVYSGEEVKTNKIWIDGKPIYRKVYLMNQLPNNSTLGMDIDLDKRYVEITDIKCIYKLELGGGISQIGIIPYINPVSDMANMGLYINNPNNQNNYRISVVTAADRTNGYAYITIEYTKTTD